MDDQLSIWEKGLLEIGGFSYPIDRVRLIKGGIQVEATIAGPLLSGLPAGEPIVYGEDGEVVWIGGYQRGWDIHILLGDTFQITYHLENKRVHG